MDKLSIIEIWLRKAFIQHKCLNEIYIIGSILSNPYSNANDVDVIQIISFFEGSEMAGYIENLNAIKNDFYKDFLKPLHITTFTQNELTDFDQFISLNIHLKII
ncbi:hypothetical protein [Mucilaginibacter sp.]|uniref:hypothetical protein n=1 Tax=Mucilaginibacter sp. TaxID=1882438 RepID=UPI003AFFC1A3